MTCITEHESLALLMTLVNSLTTGFCVLFAYDFIRTENTPERLNSQLHDQIVYQQIMVTDNMIFLRTAISSTEAAW